MQVRVEGIGISGECSKVTGGSGLIIITSGRGSNSRYYMVPRLVHAKMGNSSGLGLFCADFSCLFIFRSNGGIGLLLLFFLP